MNLSPYVETLRQHLAIAGEAGGDEGRELAERLTAPLESAARLMLLEALSGAADEITRELAPGSVEVRLRGGEPEFVVATPPGDDEFDQLAGTSVVVAGETETDDETTARLNLRLPESLKTRIEETARTEGLSLNTWLIRAATAALGSGGAPHRRSSTGGERYTGWVR